MQDTQINAIALTGGIGSGKSTVLKLFEQKGYTIFSADEMIASFYQRSHRFYGAISEFYDNWLHTNFASQEFIDKKQLRQALEQHNGFAKSIELIRPFFIEQCLHLTACQGATNYMIEVPLLFEAKMQHCFRQVIMVVASREVRFERVHKRNPCLSPEQINSIINAQIRHEDFVEQAHWLVDNSADLSHLQEQIDLIDSRLAQKQFPGHEQPGRCIKPLNS